MGTLYLAGNETAVFGAHLQFVYEDNGQFFELEVQAPDDFGTLGGDWVYASAGLNSRAHLGQNTNGTNADGTFDAAIYGRVGIATGDEADRLWANLQEINNSLVTHAAAIDYETFGTDSQNSNSFVNSLALAVGIDIQPLIAQMSEMTEDISPSAYFGSTRNIFENANNGFGTGNNYEFPTIVEGTDGDDFFRFGRGNDTITGGEGADKLHGGTGDDFLFAGEQQGTEFTVVDEDLTFNPSFADTTEENGFQGISASDYADGDVDYLYGGDGFDRYFVAAEGVVTEDGFEQARTIGQFPFDQSSSFNNDVYDRIDVISDSDGQGEIYYGLTGLDEVGLNINITSLDHTGTPVTIERDKDADGNNVDLFGRANYSFNFDENYIVDLYTNSETGVTSNRIVVYESETYHGLFAIDDFFNGSFGITLEGYRGFYEGDGGDNGIDGSGGADDLNGGAGDDIINGLGGADFITGGTGDDTIIIDEFDTGFFGDSGIDTVIYNGDADFIYALDQGSFENAQFGSGNDSIYGNAVNNNIDGGAGNDVLFGYGGNDIITGGDGADSIQGGDGDDIVTIDDDDTWFSGDGGTDTLIDTGTNGRAYALDQGSFENALFGSGNDSIYGNAAENNIDGGAGNDVLFGYGGNDTITGGDGADSIQGGDGDDTITIDDDDTWFSGDSGTDTLIDTSTSGRVYALAQGAFENAQFGSGNDIIYGSEDNNLIDGGAGDDTLFGFGGNDQLSGGAGNDELLGGTGSDIFVFSDNAGNDVIYDFEDGLDLINLASVSSINNFADLQSSATQVGANVEIDLGNGSSVEIQQFDLATQLDTSDFLFA